MTMNAKCEGLDPLGTTQGGLGSLAAPLPAGEYGLAVSALAASGQVVGMATADIIELGITDS